MSANGVRYELLLAANSATRLLYRGSLCIGEASHPVEVEVIATAAAADGWRVVVACPSAPDATRAALERTVGIMARSAVRGARKNGLTPPRRLRRWRPLPRTSARSQ